MTFAAAAALALTIGAASALQTPAQQPTAPAARRPARPPVPAVPAGETVAIVNARVMPVSGPVIERGTVLMRGGTIAAVGADVQVPPGARVIDGAGRTVTPGLMDSANEIGIVEIPLSAEGTADQATTDSRVSAAFDVVDSFNPNSTVIPVVRAEGITRALVTPSSTGNVLAGQGAVMDLGGAHAPASVTRAPAVMIALVGEAGAAVAGGSRATAILRLREILQDARDYGVNQAAYNSARRREYARPRLDLAALQPVLRGEVPLGVRANRASDLLAAIRLADEFKLRVVLIGASEGWMVAGELARRKVPVVVKALANLPTFDSLGATLENPGRLSAAGVTVALGVFETHRTGTLRQEAGTAVAYGMDREAALRAVTLAPAQIWGVADRYGSLEPGKDADVVVWSGDPFELSTRAEHVFIKGREAPKDTRQQQLFERYRDLKTMPRR
jgi:imidazolonepropionase-like amidohydrolase